MLSPPSPLARARARSRSRSRARTRGASMVEAVFVISIFVSFFFGMVYFKSVYHQKLRVQELGRAGVVAYAMNACPTGGDQLAPIRPDLQNVQDNSNNPSGKQEGTAPAATASSKPIGQQNQGDPVTGAMSSSGFTGDPLSVINLQAPASALGQSGLTTLGFQTTVHTVATMSCGDKQEDGNVNGVIGYVKDLFKL
jgi:hypothetical protein